MIRQLCSDCYNSERPLDAGLMCSGDYPGECDACGIEGEVHHVPVAVDPSQMDFGGAFDGFVVSSDADPGL